MRFCSAGNIPTIHKTSPLDLNATDPQGMTAFHHAVFSLDFGSFDNGDIIKVLMAANGDPNKPDMRGELPKDSALMRGATRIYNALQPNVSSPAWRVGGGGRGQGLSPTKIGCKVSLRFLGCRRLHAPNPLCSDRKWEGGQNMICHYCRFPRSDSTSSCFYPPFQLA